jgi:hypothetical protein
MIKRLKSHENSLKIETAPRIYFRFSKVSYNKPLIVGLGRLSGIFQTTKQQTGVDVEKIYNLLTYFNKIEPK